MLKVGITGGIGAGKSLVSNIFKVLGVPVYDADSQAKHLMQNNTDLKNDLIEVFGKNAYTEDGYLNREYLAGNVFNDEQKLVSLNNLVHPAVKMDFDNWCKHQKTNYILKEAALLIETNSYKDLDFLLLVIAPEKLRIERVLFRDSQRSVDQIKKIIQNQLPEPEKKKIADIIINNDECHPILSQVLEIHTLLSQKALNFK